MNDYMKEIREFWLSAKPLDLSTRPANVTLQHGQFWSLLLFFPLTMYFGYEFFRDWNEGYLPYETLLLVGVNLFMGLRGLSKAMVRYDLMIGMEEVKVTRKYLFTNQIWSAGFHQYQTLAFNFWPREGLTASMFSVDLVHPDPQKTIPLAAARHEVAARAQLKHLQEHLKLPVTDMVTSKQSTIQEDKKATHSRAKLQKAAIPLVLMGVGAIPIAILFWVLLTSPMKTIACTVEKHEITNVQEPSPEGPQKHLTIYYRYQYKGKEYVSPENRGDTSSNEKMQRWMDRSPEGAHKDCYVDSRDPQRILERPFSNTFILAAILPGVGLFGLGGVWALLVFYPPRFLRESQTVFERITETQIKNRIKRRYRASIRELRNLGFQGHCFYQEIISPFSVISKYMVFLAMLFKREVLNIRSPLRIATSYPLFTIPGQGTYAVVYALETKFFTLFTDGTALITGTEGRIPNFSDEETKIHRQGNTQTVDSAWKQHQGRVTVFKTEGKQEKTETLFQDYTDILSRVEKIYTENNLLRNE